MLQPYCNARAQSTRFCPLCPNIHATSQLWPTDYKSVAILNSSLHGANHWRSRGFALRLPLCPARPHFLNLFDCDFGDFGDFRILPIRPRSYGFADSLVSFRGGFWLFGVSIQNTRDARQRSPFILTNF
jgi:hypothetical protein